MFSLPPAKDAIVPGHPKFTDQFQASEIQNGLTATWDGRVFMNHPYSAGLPWVEKFVQHNNGIALTAAKSTDTRRGQLLLSTCDLALFLAGRILFHYPDGTISEGKWLPNVLWAYGEESSEALRELVAKTNYRGVYLKRP